MDQFILFVGDLDPGKAGPLLIIGPILFTVTSIVILVQAFRTSLLWGLGCLFVPLCSQVFVILYWSEFRKVAILHLVSIGIILWVVYGGLPT